MTSSSIAAAPTGGLPGRTAVVTGGSGGIGSAIVRSLAAHGATVAVVDADDRAEALAAEVGSTTA